MKAVISTTSLILSCLVLTQCSPPELDPNRPVKLSIGPKQKDGFMSASALTTKLLQSKTSTTFPIEFSGSSIPLTQNNRRQATQIQKLTSSTYFADEQFIFTIIGDNLGMNEKEALLNLLTSAKVKPHQFQIKTSSSAGTHSLIETPKKLVDRKVRIALAPQ